MKSMKNSQIIFVFFSKKKRRNKEIFHYFIKEFKKK